MKFATCLNCIDGRVQLPVIYWIKENYEVDYVDIITEPGIVGVLTEDNYSNMIFIAGHYDCAGNPVDDETYKQHIHAAVKKIKLLTSVDKVVGLWISKEWNVEKIIN